MDWAAHPRSGRKASSMTEPGKSDPAVATTPEPAQAVAAHEALSPPPSGGAPDLREKWRTKATIARSVALTDDDLYAKGYGDALWKCADDLDAALSSSVSPKGENSNG
jgi:hypothetical protein